MDDYIFPNTNFDMKLLNRYKIAFIIIFYNNLNNGQAKISEL